MRDGSEIEGLPPVKLGETPTGRAAKRGRTVRIREEAQSQLGPVGAASGPVPNGGMQSGIIVPLIVGARVVGTLACWSFTTEAFNDEDERILEMMASQVATAVAVADTTEASERRAHQDALTGLPNRLQLSEDLQGELAVLHAAGRRAVVAMADIDHFKHVNDENGHHLGDIVLQAVAHVLRSAVRASDRVYRYGGEEFVIVFMDAEPQPAFLLADRLREAVEVTSLGSDSETIGPVTISIGLAALPDHGTDIESLISIADDAMYQAKDAGRNRVVLYGSSKQVLSEVA
jgi:diguanylate cyclase (GGDEF)-like protein